MATSQNDPLAPPEPRVAAAKPAPLRVNFLSPRSISQAEQAYTRHFALAPHGTTEADLTRPEFYQAVCNKLKRGDRIDVMADDLTFYADVLVMGVTPTSADAEVLSFKSLNKRVAGEDLLLAEHEVLYVPTSKWRVVRKADQRTLSENHNSRNDAMGWLIAHKSRSN